MQRERSAHRGSKYSSPFSSRQPLPQSPLPFHVLVLEGDGRVTRVLEG